ncbi:MAG TPA: glycosyltransferase family 2 protein [Terriglobales bacterium]|nr:glycosyltransferase family 2 protein [Terriglobales bacterium]
MSTPSESIPRPRSSRDESDVLVSAVIVSWNCRAYVLECLASLCAGDNARSMEIIVVDNASTDGTVEAIAARFPDNVRLIRNAHNVGFSRANNIALQLCRGQYVCLINADVVVPPGCIEKMANYLDGHREVGLLGPRMLCPNGRMGNGVMRFPTVWNTFCCALGLHRLFPASGLLGGFVMAGFEPGATQDVEVLTGWFWMTRCEALRQVGGLDEQFFMYGEDIDWCYRFRKAGWRVVFYAGAEALHYRAASSDNSPQRFYVEMQRANLQYFRKHHNWTGRAGYWVARCIHEAIRVAGFSLIYLLRPSRRPEAALKILRGVACIGFLTGLRTTSDK